MTFLKENLLAIALFSFSALGAFIGTLRDDNLGKWLTIIGILFTLIVGIWSCYQAYKDITSLRSKNDELKKKIEALEESFDVKRDSDGNVVDHNLIWKEY